MTYRRKLLTVFALTVFLAVAAIVTAVSVITRRAFEQANAVRTSALLAQFQREFERRGTEVRDQVESIAKGDIANRMAVALNRDGSTAGAFLNDAKSLAETQQLDFLEFVDGDGTIISSAQWPAKFGYKDNSLSHPAEVVSKGGFLKFEDLRDGSVLGLFAISATTVGEKTLYVVGGRKIDSTFLASLPLPAGMRAMLYENPGQGSSPKMWIDSSGTVARPEALSSLIQQVSQQGQEVTDVVHWSTDARDDETVRAIPLRGADNQLLGVLMVGDSRRAYVDLTRHIQSAALLIGGGGILVAILVSGWAAARVTRPVEQLAHAASQVAAGDWGTRVEVQSPDELGELAESFNRMTQQLLDQKERLLQTERVAAWRELARRLAHELKNPLFPIQLTVENMIRAREQSPAVFEEMFNESSSALLAEIANLKTIVSRFSEFSKMPQPQWQRVQLNEIVLGVMKLFEAQFQSEKTPIEREEHLGQLDPMVADGDLLHRAISNLVLNSMDAMPQGGTLGIRTWQQGERVYVEVSDTGAGLTQEEAQRIFTPYYTSKQHGTGLGLAIVQSVISDHGGKIEVESAPGHGTTFRIELPKNMDKLANSSAGEVGTTG